MTHSKNSETPGARGQRQWFIMLAFGVNGADAAPPELPAVPVTRDVLP